MKNIINENESKRLNINLDGGSFEKLESITKNHGGISYTQAIKKAITLLEYIDQKQAEGLEIYLEGKNKNIREKFLII